jgi:hypothetical protein
LPQALLFFGLRGRGSGEALRDLGLIEALDGERFLPAAKTVNNLNVRRLDTEGGCDQANERLVGRAIHRRRGEADPQSVAMPTDDLVALGAGLNANEQRRHIQGCVDSAGNTMISPLAF